MYKRQGYDKVMEVPSLSGCFMFIRTDVLKQIGGVDKRVFMYAEDVGLCRRVGEVTRTMYYPEVSVVHEYEKGSYKNRKLLKYHMCSVIKYFNKWEMCIRDSSYYLLLDLYHDITVSNKGMTRRTRVYSLILLVPLTLSLIHIYLL